MGLTTLVNNGDPDNRVDIVFLGDGYRAADMPAYFADVQAFADYLFTGAALTEPFGRYATYFNVHAIDVASVQAGADDPTAGTFVNTALGSTYLFDGETQRLLYVDDDLAINALEDGLDGTGVVDEMRFVAINSAQYGGGGGLFATYSAGNESAMEIAVHEIAHSFVALADEYDGFADPYTGAEPADINITADPTGSKWARWLGFQDPILGLVGAFEGGGYYDQGIYRPTANSKMRELERPFDPIAREAFVLGFYELVDPLDDFSQNGQSMTLNAVQALFVDPIDPALIQVEWSLDGTIVQTGGLTLDVASLGLEMNNTYQVSVRAYDDTDWVRLDRSSLEQTVTWTFALWEPVSGGGGADTLAGTADNDRLIGEGGDDVLNGDAGNDELIGDSLTTAGVSGNDTLNGGAGDDFAWGQGGNDLLQGGAGNDSLFGNLGDDTVQGGVGDDLIRGHPGDDILDGEAGNDTIFGGADNDSLDGRDGVDVLNGNSGFDTVNGGAGNDTLRGQGGRDALNGDAGNDLLVGMAGFDTLNGGDGNDTLIGGPADDTLTGGAGVDIFTFGADQGANTVTDYADGTDMIQVAGVSGFGDLALTSTPDGTQIAFLGTTVLLQDVAIGQLSASDFIFS
ncbi:MAG: M64 family metallopeptidase [Alphaproteobacteria bacterium]